MIETAYLSDKNELKVRISHGKINYVVDFVQNIQVREDDHNRIRSIRRMFKNQNQQREQDRIKAKTTITQRQKNQPRQVEVQVELIPGDILLINNNWKLGFTGTSFIPMESQGTSEQPVQKALPPFAQPLYPPLNENQPIQFPTMFQPSAPPQSNNFQF